jgi:tRNA uridine 5-carboxymethylaminomethyl modification enzyme
LKAFGFEWGRLKTGTPPRLDRHSIDFDGCVADGRFALEPGDDPPVPFSFLSEAVVVDQLPCYLLHTNDRVRHLVLANIEKSPLFNWQIQGIGPRYCPSLEDKIAQGATVELLEAVYEQDFLPCSYGFRPGRGAQDALDEVGRVICRRPIS